MIRWHVRPRHHLPPQPPYTDGTAPLPYPAGWFLLAPARHLRPGAVLTRQMMGQDVVVYRTHSGQARAIRPYCPHLGAHLGCGGRVEGETIVCPFHHFAFDATGAVARTGPGYTGQAVQDRLDTLACQEANGAIFAWFGHDPAQPPTWHIPNLLHPDAARPRFASTELAGHPQEIGENIVDIGHTRALHGIPDAELLAAPVPQEHRYTTELRLSRAFPPFGKLTVDLTVTLHGLGLIHALVRAPRYGLTADVLGSARPTAPWRVEFTLGTSITLATDSPPWQHLPPTTTRLLSHAVNWLNLAAALRDVEPDLLVWNTKRYLQPPRLTQGDGPIGPFRLWARQFYPGQETTDQPTDTNPTP
ncbi:Rieske 2Fe-2S domain-containing protein [Streptomyces violascens]|uniref:Rieske 2Fe-2S domain-containing protein n=1 Tax=Streptomyces violascens TaxID=67381 RepID=UPI0036BDDA45